MGAEFWIDENKGEDPLRIWDKLILGGITWPGMCQLETTVALGMAVNKYLLNPAQNNQPAKYQIGLTDQGYEPGRIKAQVQIWTSQQWKDMQDILPRFSPRTGEKQATATALDDAVFFYTGKDSRPKRLKGSARDAFDIIHPSAAILAIDSVIVTGITIPPVTGQTMVVQVDMIQYFPKTGHRVLHSSGGALDEKDFRAPSPKANGNLKA